MCRSEFRFRERTVKHLLDLSLTGSDPTRTSAVAQCMSRSHARAPPQNAIVSPLRCLGWTNEAARISRCAWRRGRVAARGARAAAGNAGDRIPEHPISRYDGGSTARISPGPERHRLCRGRECSHRLPLGREPARPAASAGDRTGPPTARPDRDGIERRVRSQGGNRDDPNRLRHRRRPGQARTCRESLPGRAAT